MLLNVTQQLSHKQYLATPQTVGVAVLGIVLHLVHAALGESILESVQMLREIVALARRFESLHSPFSNSCRLMRVLRPIIQSLVRSMLHARHHSFLCGFVTLQFVGDHHPWHKPLSLQQLVNVTRSRQNLIGVPID